MSKSILRDNAYGAILAAILDGRLAPGENLREQRLAADLHVSRTPIREALHKLAEEGFVAYEPHRGARLLAPTPAMAREVFQIREGLEAIAAHEAASRISDETLAALRARFDQLRPLIRAGDRTDLGDSIHDAMFAACGNSRLLQLMNVLRGQIRWLQSVAVTIPARPARAFREHLAILTALDARDPEAAEAATRLHIRSTLNDLLKSLPTP
jgi:DNA-binding GntR family transcriptional regulator